MRAIDCTRYSPRIYVLADTYEHSERKVMEFEHSTQSNDSNCCFRRIPRSREVRQSYLTSVFTTVRATASAVPLIVRERPSLLLCNGPGTCIPICAAYLILKVRVYKFSTLQWQVFYSARLCEQVFSLRTRLLVFVESVCRVKSLSVSGLILYYSHIADEIIVLWPELVQKFPRVRYLGNIL